VIMVFLPSGYVFADMGTFRVFQRDR
jgi:hypothetical protein